MIFLTLLGFIGFDGRYVIEDAGASQIKTIVLDYSFERPCRLHLYFTKGYELYGIDVNVENTKGTLELKLDEARLIPTRRKPVRVPPTLEGTCRGAIDNLKIR